MGRARTVERRKEREQQKKRQRQTYILIGIVVAAVLVVLLLLLVNGPAEAPIPADTLTRYQGIPQSNSPEGFPILGNTNAPVKVIEYSSFDCPHCQEFNASVFPALVDRVRKGEVEYTFVPVWNTGGIANGQGAAYAAVCAGEQGKFWEMQDALFSWQATYVNTAFTQNRFAAGVTNLGLDSAKWNQCMGSDLPGKVVSAAIDASKVQNIAGTPAIYVNGTAVTSADLNAVNGAIDSALAQAGPVVQPTVQTAPPTATAQPASEATATVTSETTAEATTAP
jgi:protein-disulfide isomerase